MHGIIIEQLKNYPVDSNCYVIKKAKTGRCLLVDPAQGDGEDLYQYLLLNNYIPEYIVLTHEHFDHISSTDYLRQKFTCKIIASAACSERIMHPKKNLSLFRDGVGFSCGAADLIIDGNNLCFAWDGTALYFHLTPGHSEGGLCFSIGDNLFTGDTLLQHHKPVVKLPGGDRKKLKESIEMLFRLFKGTTQVYPGHGQPFPLAAVSVFSLIPG